MTEEQVVRLTEKLEQYFNAAKEVLLEYGPDVAEFGLTVLRVEAAAELLPAIMYAIIAFLLVKYADPRKLFARIKDIPKFDDARFGLGLLGTFSLAGIATSIFLVVFYLLNVWAWVGIFYPEAYAVHYFLMK